MASPWTVQYYQKVLATNPIAYWPLDEKAGTVAYDLVSRRVAGAQNGAHTAVTLYQPGIGDGRRSASYNGTTSYTNVFSAAFAAAFSGATGTMMIWAKVSAAGVWTDGATRMIFRIEVDGDNFVLIRKSDVNNTLAFIYEANNVQEASNVTWSSTAWFCIAATWAKPGSFFQYINGTLQAEDVIDGVWAGVPTLALIGAQTLVPANVWSGSLGHAAVWNRALSPDEIAQLAVVM